MISRSRFRGLWVVWSFFAAAAFADTNSVEFFGLSHTTLGAATFGTNTGLEVFGIGTNGEDGVRSELGAADSGVFIYPHTDYVQPGYLMSAKTYGSVNGQSNSLIGTIYGYRADYAQFYAGADYSSIGATNLTFQLWYGFVLVAETTMTNGEVFMYGEYASPPRVNPWWRRENGDYGESIEFSYPLPVTLPGGASLNGDRIFIRPNGATGVVDYVSRTDVFGNGGLQTFRYREMRLGMFGHAHLPVNSVQFVARPGALTVNQIPAGEDGGGCVVELPPSARATVNFSPIEMAIPNTNGTRHRLNLSAAGTRSNVGIFIGSLAFANTNGVIEFTPLLEDEAEVTVDVLSNNVLVGTVVLPLVEPAASIEGRPRIISFDASADTLSGTARLAVGFDTNATITFTNGTQFVGNRIVARKTQWTQIADVSALAGNTTEIASFTIVSETAESNPPPRVDIFRSGTNIVLRWLDPAQAYKVGIKTSVDNYFSDSGLEPSYSNGVASVEYLPPFENVFFRLQRYFYPYYNND